MISDNAAHFAPVGIFTDVVRGKRYRNFRSYRLGSYKATQRGSISDFEGVNPSARKNTSTLTSGTCLVYARPSRVFRKGFFRNENFFENALRRILFKLLHPPRGHSKQPPVSDPPFRPTSLVQRQRNSHTNIYIYTHVLIYNRNNSKNVMRVHRRSGDGLLVRGENSSRDTAASAVAFFRPVVPVHLTGVSVQTSLLHAVSNVYTLHSPTRP